MNRLGRPTKRLATGTRFGRLVTLGARCKRLRSAEYRVWQGMKTRCANPRSSHYRHYGGRGITVCRRWNDFANFYADMGARPTPQHTVERVDNNRGYTPSNCRMGD